MFTPCSPLTTGAFRFGTLFLTPFIANLNDFSDLKDLNQDG